MARRRDIARQDVRVDMSSVSAAEARRLFEQYDGLVHVIASSFPAIEHDELIAAGRIGVMEAAATRDPKRLPERPWVTQVVRWRMLAVAARTRELADREAPISDIATNGVHDPERAYQREALIGALARLDPRERVIIDSLLRGYTYEEISGQLGISRARVGQVAQRARVRLRELVRMV